MSSLLLFAPGLHSPLLFISLHHQQGLPRAMLCSGSLHAGGESRRVQAQAHACCRGLIETGSGREAKSQRAEAWGGGIVDREEVEPVLSFLYICPPLPPKLLAACDRKLIGIS